MHIKSIAINSSGNTVAIAFGTALWSAAQETQSIAMSPTTAWNWKNWQKQWSWYDLEGEQQRLILQSLWTRARPPIRSPLLQFHFHISHWIHYIYSTSTFRIWMKCTSAIVCIALHNCTCRSTRSFWSAKKNNNKPQHNWSMHYNWCRLGARVHDAFVYTQQLAGAHVHSIVKCQMIDFAENSQQSQPKWSKRMAHTVEKQVWKNSSSSSSSSQHNWMANLWYTRVLVFSIPIQQFCFPNCVWVVVVYHLKLFFFCSLARVCVCL